MGYNGVQKTVGFATFKARDTQAPAQARNLKVVTDGSKDQLSWMSVAERGVTYQVIRNNKVVAVTDKPYATVEHVDGARYFVRAADAQGNFSATTSMVRATEGKVLDQPAENVLEASKGKLIENGSTWQYKLGLATPDSSWTSVKTTEGSWSEGKAAIGWGDKSLGTTVDRGTDRPLALYARKEFTINRAETVKSLTLTTYADDGIAVYVNGKEVARENLKDGELTHNIWATTATNTTEAAAQPVTITVPAEYLNEGTNVVAVEVHGNYRNTQNLSFDLAAELNSK